MRVTPFLVLAVGCGLLLGSTASAHAQAQIPNGIPQGLMPGFGLSPNGPFTPQFGGQAMNGGMGGGLTQQQFGNLLGLRALQGMGHHGVQTGVQNPIMNGYGSPPGIMPGDEQYPASGSSKHKSSHAKRDAARAEKAEQKRLAAAAKEKPKAERASKKSRTAREM